MSWLSVNTRLPIDDEFVLVSAGDGEVIIGMFDVELNMWFDYPNEESITVLAWMPLPPPYEKARP